MGIACFLFEMVKKIETFLNSSKSRNEKETMGSWKKKGFKSLDCEEDKRKTKWVRVYNVVIHAQRILKTM